jgi:hypothetical protein
MLGRKTSTSCSLARLIIGTLCPVAPCRASRYLCAKPISVDIVETAVLAAARNCNGAGGHAAPQTPHLAEARDRLFVSKLGKVRFAEIYCYYHMRATENPPDTAPPSYLG